MVANCLVALGANLPTSTRAPIEHLRYALEVLEGESVSLAALSLWYSTPAFPVGSGPDYVNAVAKFKTGLDAYELIELLSKTERKLGRIREDRWGARVCDLDLLSFEDRILPDIQTYQKWLDLPLDRQKSETPSELILPHPRIQDRAFVLIPLRDVEPNWVHPVSGQTIDALIAALDESDLQAIRPMDSADLTT